MNENPYRIPEPFVISFSGGRTSGYMLRKILNAYDGKLPERGKVIFCNTGKEREETLEFVERCSQRWGVEIIWLEYRWEPGRHYFVVVNYATASRKGEPFEMVIEARGGILPNVMMRFCTAEMKIRTNNRYVRQTLGWDEYYNAIGFRSDEPKRVAKMQRKAVTTYTATLWDDWIIKETSRSTDLPPGEKPVFPLFDADANLESVMDFWLENRGGYDLNYWLKMPFAKRPGFDLELSQAAGNCDLCFLKGSAKILRLMAERPESAQWWIDREAAAQGRCRNKSVENFRMDRPPYADLLAIAQGKDAGPGWLWADKQDGSCGEIDECRCTD